MSLLLKNCRFLVTQNRRRQILEGTDVLIEGTKISRIGGNLRADEVLDCSNSLVMPGLINSHTHIAMTLLRGIADDVKLEDFLKKTFAIDSKMTGEDVYAGALLGCIESIRFGTTCFNDLYYFEDEIARAAEVTGIRCSLAWAVLNKEFTTQKGEPLKNCERFIKDWKGKSELIKPAVGPEGVYVCSEETYKSAMDLSEKYKVDLHTHLSETRKEVYDHVKNTGKRPVEWLEGIGFLNSRLTAAHCVWLTKREMDTIAKRRVRVSHNPTSNLKLASGGLAPVPELSEMGVSVSLGTDSCASNNNLDMFKEMKLAALLHKNCKWDATLIPAQRALDMATIEGAKALDVKVGSIEEGMLADLIVIHLNKPHLNPISKANVISNIVYSMCGADVDTSIIGGKIVMRDRVIKGESEAIKKSNEALDGIKG
jgi:5-methylthioadenosine/S-adenosylhomocysteine deaminase